MTDTGKSTNDGDSKTPLNRDFESKYDKESRLRSLLKGISWRIVGTIDTMIISWLVTGNLVFAATIGSVEVITKLALYYFHERAWQMIPRGSVRRFWKFFGR